MTFFLKKNTYIILYSLYLLMIKNIPVIKITQSSFVENLSLRVLNVRRYRNKIERRKNKIKSLFGL